MSGIGVRVTVQETGGLSHADASGVVRRVGSDLTQKLAEATLAAASTGIPVDLGGVIGSGEVVTGDMQAAVQYTSPHVMYVHGAWGTAPGSRSVPHWPPKGALAGWAERHGIPEFLVRRAISRNGTPLVPFLEQATKAREGWDGIEQQALADLKAGLVGG